jgi:hypothetical protein
VVRVDDEEDMLGCLVWELMVEVERGSWMVVGFIQGMERGHVLLI